MASLAAVGTFISTAAPILSAGTALMQFGAQRTAASQAEAEGKIAAQQEELAATQREADRKERLASAMASQIAGSGAKGVLAFEGSPLTILQEDVKREEVATQRDVFQSKLAGMTARQRAKNKAKGLRTGAGIGLITDLASVAQTLPAGE